MAIPFYNKDKKNGSHLKAFTPFYNIIINNCSNVKNRLKRLKIALD